MTVHEFPTDVTGMIEAIADMYRNGVVREVIIFAPNAKDPGAYHFRASDGIRLTDVLVAKQYLARLADRLCDNDAS